MFQTLQSISGQCIFSVSEGRQLQFVMIILTDSCCMMKTLIPAADLAKTAIVLMSVLVIATHVGSSASGVQLSKSHGVSAT